MKTINLTALDILTLKMIREKSLLESTQWSRVCQEYLKDEGLITLVIPGMWELTPLGESITSKL